ncbi:thioredoxin family protein [Desulfofustis glycolicus]|uniref:Thioredoxin 1 n=1 Tax=Desulfofustis glycolicus DSM 9705 TaxID=1121409 RepID=A0A1M5V6F3_9BACT|nr:thioredoxin family protein [Desulfofustis glycolicus]MCB2214958.1 thioredoxin family protein [Desulfobulbaceae bacterium]SHH70796.1 thioredoxin 1 [Desulfofustis glycolicus DSM 9705]
MEEKITLLNRESFGEFVKNNDCLVAFFKSKCPNCKVLLKVMEKCKAGRPEIAMACISSEDEEAVARMLAIGRVPTVLVYKGGEEKTRKSGVMKPAELEDLYLRA